jgi:hypothetical protein
MLERSGAGSMMPFDLRAPMETRLGEPFNTVRIHTDAAAAEASRLIHAHAFTMGHDIYFAEGRFQPSTPARRKLLAHELAHVAQQSSGSLSDAVVAEKPAVRPSDDSYEREADRVADSIEAAGPSPGVSTAATLSIQLQGDKPDQPPVSPPPAAPEPVTPLEPIAKLEENALALLVVNTLQRIQTTPKVSPDLDVLNKNLALVRETFTRFCSEAGLKPPGRAGSRRLAHASVGRFCICSSRRGHSAHAKNRFRARLPPSAIEAARIGAGSNDLPEPQEEAIEAAFADLGVGPGEDIQVRPGEACICSLK